MSGRNGQRENVILSETDCDHKQQSVHRKKVSSKSILKLVESQEFKCGLTGRELTPDIASIDHVTPLSAGGSNCIDNLQVLHADVNRAKGTMLPQDFIDLCREVVEWVDANGYRRG